MQIGNLKRIYTVEPIEDPVPPVRVPAIAAADSVHVSPPEPTDQPTKPS